MLCSIDEMRNKEVVDINTGERLGYIDDAVIDVSAGTAEKLLIYGGSRFFGLFGRDDDVVIKCSEVKVIGSDIILVERNNTDNRAESTKNRKKSFESLFR